MSSDTLSATTANGAGETVASHEAAVLRRRRLVRLCQILFGIGFLAVWQLASGRLIDPFYVASPSIVLARLWSWIQTGQLVTNLATTLKAMALGFLLGAGFGFTIGLTFGRFRFLADVLDPYITALYCIPVIALAPLFIMWFGIGLASKVAVSAVIVFFVVFLNTYSGIREVNPVYISATRIMGATEWDVMRTVIVPSAAAWMMAGLKVSVPYALVGAVIGEFISSNEGVGFLIAQATGLFDTGGVFAGLLILACVGALINGLVKLFEGHALRWRA